MRLFIDGREINWDGGNINVFWQLVERELTKDNRLVVRIRCDGVDINKTALEDYLASVNNIEIFSSTPSEIMVSAFEDARDYLPRLREGLTEMVKLIQEGSEGEAVKLFLKALEGIEWLAVLLNSVNTLGVPQEIPDSAKGTILRFGPQFTEQLENLEGAWGNFDYLLVADILEYEIVPLIKELEEVVQTANIRQ